MIFPQIKSSDSESQWCPEKITDTNTSNQDYGEKVTFQVSVYSLIKLCQSQYNKLIYLYCVKWLKADDCGPTVSSQLSVAQSVHVLDIRRQFVMDHLLVFLLPRFSLKSK